MVSFTIHESDFARGSIHPLISSGYIPTIHRVPHSVQDSCMYLLTYWYLKGKIIGFKAMMFGQMAVRCMHPD